ncbi:Homeobox domain [Trinorchestia longiramus]|nr:Homeobox domain [Trinorchestia longiramus]
MNDYCFALQSYPKCNYEQLRDFLMLPCKRKLQYITSSIDKDQVLRETFDKVQTLQQKNVFLLVDEVQIHPTVSISGGSLSGMAENNRDSRATSILITKERLAEECSSSDVCKEGPVKIWFQNRRVKHKKEDANGAPGIAGQKCHCSHGICSPAPPSSKNVKLESKESEDQDGDQSKQERKVKLINNCNKTAKSRQELFRFSSGHDRCSVSPNQARDLDEHRLLTSKDEFDDFCSDEQHSETISEYSDRLREQSVRCSGAQDNDDVNNARATHISKNILLGDNRASDPHVDNISTRDQFLRSRFFNQSGFNLIERFPSHLVAIKPKISQLSGQAGALDLAFKKRSMSPETPTQDFLERRVEKRMRPSTSTDQQCLSEPQAGTITATVSISDAQAAHDEADKPHDGIWSPMEQAASKRQAEDTSLVSDVCPSKKTKQSSQESS